MRHRRSAIVAQSPQQRIFSKQLIGCFITIKCGDAKLAADRTLVRRDGACAEEIDSRWAGVAVDDRAVHRDGPGAAEPGDAAALSDGVDVGGDGAVLHNQIADEIGDADAGPRTGGRVAGDGAVADNQPAGSDSSTEIDSAAGTIDGQTGDTSRSIA